MMTFRGVQTKLKAVPLPGDNTLASVFRYTYTDAAWADRAMDAVTECVLAMVKEAQHRPEPRP